MAWTFVVAITKGAFIRLVEKGNGNIFLELFIDAFGIGFFLCNYETGSGVNGRVSRLNYICNFSMFENC